MPKIVDVEEFDKVTGIGKRAAPSAAVIAVLDAPLNSAIKFEMDEIAAEAQDGEEPVDTARRIRNRITTAVGKVAGKPFKVKSKLAQVDGEFDHIIIRKLANTEDGADEEDEKDE